MVDYTKMQTSDFLFAVGDDAAKWAAAFCQHAKNLGYSDMDEEWVIGWFANAIEGSAAFRKHKAAEPGPVVIKDFPGRKVDQFLKSHGRLPSEDGGSHGQ